MRAGIQKQHLLLLIYLPNELNCPFGAYSKTTFVTVNRKGTSCFGWCLFIQKQHLLLLIGSNYKTKTTVIKFKNNICYC